jgi:hypothetical protein
VMEITYSKHLQNRLQLRGIDPNLPQRIYEESGERYLDSETGHVVALMRTQLYGNTRDVMIAYEISDRRVIILTHTH